MTKNPLSVEICRQANNPVTMNTIAGNVCYAGYGFFGTEMIRCPSIDVTLTRTTNQSENSSKYDSDVLNAKLLKL
ncbi:MAG: hypothetical protein ACK49F_13830, partial [Bacteroidota bacterium]